MSTARCETKEIATLIVHSIYGSKLFVNALFSPSQLRTLNFRQDTSLTMYTLITLFLKEQSTMIYYGTDSTLFVPTYISQTMQKYIADYLKR